MYISDAGFRLFLVVVALVLGGLAALIWIPLGLAVFGLAALFFSYAVKTDQREFAILFAVVVMSLLLFVPLIPWQAVGLSMAIGVMRAYFWRITLSQV